MKWAYWSREIAGWAIICAGLWQFWNTYELLAKKRIFEAAPAAFIGFIVFRSGIHLLKVAVAAQAARSLPESSAQPQTRKASRMAAKTVATTPAKSVIPGPKSRAASSNGMVE